VLPGMQRQRIWPEKLGFGHDDLRAALRFYFLKKLEAAAA